MTRTTMIAHLVFASAILTASPGLGQKAARRPIKPVNAAPTAPLIVNLPVGAPFTRLQIQASATRPCPRNGCELSITGIAATGRRTDVTFDDVLTNGFPGTKVQMVGALDGGGMPRLTYEQGNLDGDNTFNVFGFDRDAGRYRFLGTVDGYGKPLEQRLPSVSAARSIASVPAAAGERSISYAGVATMKRLTLVQGVELKIRGNQVTGNFGQRILGQTLVTKLTGEIANGRCTLKIGRDTLVGPCDERSFSGERLSKSGKVVGTFEFKEQSIALADGSVR